MGRLAPDPREYPIWPIASIPAVPSASILLQGCDAMTWLFSKRCKDALKTGKLRVSIPQQVRVRILLSLRKNDDSFSEVNDTGFRYDTSHFEHLPANLKAELGLEDFLAYPKAGSGDPKPADFEGFILRGTFPSYVWDACEMFYLEIPGTKKLSFQADFNSIMEETGLGWRMAEGKIFPMDSAYVEAVLRNAASFAHQAGFEGAVQEFEKARTDLANQDYSGAIQNANLAVESTAKAILGIERAKPGELFRALTESGIVPDYLNGFLKAWDEHFVRSVASIRNNELGAGHGQGKAINQISPSLAELAVDLAGVIVQFLTKRHLERSPKGEAPEKPATSGDLEEVPF